MKWHAEPPRSGDGSWRIVDDSGNVIGYVETGPLDAARVAAAPEMLEALQQIMTDPAYSGCPRIKGKSCHTRRCLVLGGYIGPSLHNADIATCEGWEAHKAIAKAEGTA